MKSEAEKYNGEIKEEIENIKARTQITLNKMEHDNKMEEKKLDQDFNKFLIGCVKEDKDKADLAKIIATQNNQQNPNEKMNYEKPNVNPQLYQSNVMPQGYFPQMPMPYIPPYFMGGMGGFPIGMSMNMYPQQQMAQMAFQGQFTPNGFSNTNTNIQPMNNDNNTSINNSCPNQQIK